MRAKEERATTIAKWVRIKTERYGQYTDCSEEMEGDEKTWGTERENWV